MQLSRAIRASRAIRVSIATVAGLLIAVTLAPAAGAAPEHRVQPLRQAHAHNDYEHERPLFDALAHGFTSVEADVWLVGGALLVGHDPEDLRPDRTLQSLYLDPLADRVRANYGKVYPGRPMLFQLLIDIKSEGVSTYLALDQVLRQPRYMRIFSAYRNGRVHDRAVTAVISGNRPGQLMYGQRHRLAFYDGRIANEQDFGPGDDARLVPLVSDNWTVLFSWAGVGEMPAAERARLRDIVATAHSAGQRVRFWATPDLAGEARTAVWTELLAAGVDHINTDDLAGLEQFLRDRQRHHAA